MVIKDSKQTPGLTQFQTLEDKEILEKLKSEESRNYAFNMLVRKYQKKVYSITRKMVIDHDDADDICQEIFLKIWNNLHQFREDAQLFTWIYRIATNESLSFLRKKKTRFFLPINNSSEALGRLLDQHTGYSGEEIQLKLQKAILTLPDKQRLVFNMKYYEDLKYEDMAEITGTSVGALKASYHLAVKKIEEKLLQD